MKFKAPDSSRGVCVVVGGGGFVGSAVVAESQRRGYATVVVNRENYEASRGIKCDLLVNANGNSKKFLAARDPRQEFDLSVRSVMHTLCDFQPRRYVFLSTIDVYNDHENTANNTETAVIDQARLSPYGLHKYMAEQLVRFYAPSWLILRMGGFVGNGLKKNSIYDLLKNQPLRVHPDSEYQYLHSATLAEIVFDLAGMTTGNDLFNVCGDGLIPLRDVAWMIPGVDMGRFPLHAPAEKYEVNIAKLKAVRPVPLTRETVRNFVHDVLNGKAQIS